MKSLRQSLQRFKTEIMNNFESDVLSGDEITHEILKFFGDDESFLAIGYVNSNNIKQFCRVRPHKDRRIIKMSCISSCPSENEILCFKRNFDLTMDSTYDLLERRISNNPVLFRADIYQKRLPWTLQINIMEFIMKNAVFNPGKNKLRKIRVSKIRNSAMRIFLRYGIIFWQFFLHMDFEFIYL